MTLIDKIAWQTFYCISKIHLYANRANAELSQNKENILLKNSPGFTVLQTQLAFFLSSQNKGVILDSYSSEIFLSYAKSFIDNVLLVKMARY